jgi:isopenicillin N synthase-like dioxygenase
VLAGDGQSVQRAAAELARLPGGRLLVHDRHDVPQSLIDETFAAAQRFHALPTERKLALKANRYNVGYLPLKGTTTRHAALTATRRPNLLEAFMMKRDTS